MKKAFFFLLLLTIVIACNRKALPVITDRTKEPSAPVSRAVNVKPDIVLGKTIYTTRCARCHDLYEPSKYTAERWDGILKIMIPRARLTPEESVHVTAYVKGASSK